MRAWALTILVLAASGAASVQSADVRKPRLNVRVSPRVAFTPVSVVTTAELVGGDEVEEYHCPRLEWDWGDGSRSAHEADCAPFDASTAIDRRYTASHVYRSPGQYDIRLTMFRATRPIAVGTVVVSVQSGLGTGASEF
jgi:hypothetical protein